MFAETEFWTLGVVGAFSTLTGALGGVAVMVLKEYLPYRLKSREQTAKLRRDEFTEVLESYQRLIQEHEEQGQRREAILQNQQTVIEALQQENVECREESAEQRKAIYFIYDVLKRQHQALLDAGQNPGPLLELPEMRERNVQRGAADFLARQAQQKVALVHELDAQLAKQKAELPGAPAPEGQSDAGPAGRK